MTEATRRITGIDDIHAIHTQLLQPAFPASELVSVGWLTSAVAAGEASVLVVEDASGPLGTAVTERLGSSGSVLLSYFATRADMRGQGVGSRLFAQMLDAVRLQESPRLVVAEVERPDRHSGSPEHGDPTARLRFYGRHGARALDLPYFQPAIGPEAEPVHGMLLLALWVDPALLVSVGDGHALSGPDLVAGAIDAIVETPPADDSVETAALRSASRVEDVLLYAVEDYQQIVASR